MEISFIRHGKSNYTENSPITCSEFKVWVKNYDLNGVVEENSYPTETLKKVATAKLVVTSDLKRSIESAQLLMPKIKTVSSPLFREIELPVPKIGFSSLKLNPMIWAVTFRCLWLAGYSSNCESYLFAKQRAKKAAKLLISYAKDHKSVLLVGHGFFNRMIAKELLEIGWKGSSQTSTKHWHVTTYSFK